MYKIFKHDALVIGSILFIVTGILGLIDPESIDMVTPYHTYFQLTSNKFNFLLSFLLLLIPVGIFGLRNVFRFGSVVATCIGQAILAMGALDIFFAVTLGQYANGVAAPRIQILAEQANFIILAIFFTRGFILIVQEVATEFFKEVTVIKGTYHTSK